jgi:magnesium-transporting ATPase (P-type)
MCSRSVEILGMLILPPETFFSQIISRCIYELKSIHSSANLCFTVHNWLHLTLVLAILAIFSDFLQILGANLYFTVYNWLHLTLVLAILAIFSDFLQILGRICEHKHGLYSENFSGHKGGLFEYFISPAESKLHTSEHGVKKGKVQEAS